MIVEIDEIFKSLEIKKGIWQDYGYSKYRKLLISSFRFISKPWAKNYEVWLVKKIMLRSELQNGEYGPPLIFWSQVMLKVSFKIEHFLIYLKFLSYMFDFERDGEGGGRGNWKMFTAKKFRQIRSRRFQSENGSDKSPDSPHSPIPASVWYWSGMN